MTEEQPYVIEVTQNGNIIVHHSDDESDTSHQNSNPIKKNTIKKNLNEDIYALTAIVYAKNQRLPIGLTLISIFICLLQFAGLFGLSYGYHTENNTMTALVYNIQILQYNNQILINSTSNDNKIVLQEITQIYGNEENFNVLNAEKVRQKFAELDTAKIFLGFVALFILLLYMLQSMSTATFFWYLPDHVSDYKSIPGLKIMVKFVAIINGILIYTAWMIGVWTLFHFGDAIDIVDSIMTPLGIVFVLEVDDWIVTPYLMIEVENHDSEFGDVDDNYDDHDDLWIIHTTRNHIRQFKQALLIEFLSMILPPIFYFIATEIKRRQEKIDPDNFFWNDSMFTGGLAIFTYCTVFGVVTISLGIRTAISCYNKTKH